MPEDPKHAREVPPDDGPEALVETIDNAITALFNLKTFVQKGGDGIGATLRSNVLVIISERLEDGFDVETFAYGHVPHWQPILTNFVDDLADAVEDILGE